MYTYVRVRVKFDRDRNDKFVLFIVFLRVTLNRDRNISFVSTILKSVLTSGVSRPRLKIDHCSAKEESND